MKNRIKLIHSIFRRVCAIFRRTSVVLEKVDPIIKRKTLVSLRNSAEANAFYAMQRIDLLIISVSGAGIYACWDVLKYVKSEKLCACLENLKVSGVLFLLAIIINFVGQWASYKANTKDEYINRLKIDELDEGVKDGHKSTIDDTKYWKEFYSDVVKVTNVISLLTLFTGLLILSFFVANLF